MKIKAKLQNVTRDYNTGKPILSFLVLDNIYTLEDIENEPELDLEVKKHREKRSLNANSYFWKLLQELCNKQNLDTIEEYKKRVKELGIFRQFKIMTEQVGTFKKVWEDRGLAWFCEILDTEYIGNQEFKIINSYYGSSSFNTKIMSRLIDNLVQDCQAIGIETKSDKDIKNLLESWR